MCLPSLIVTPEERRANPGRRARLRSSDLRELSRLDEIHQDVPLFSLEDGEVAGLADSHLAAVDLNFGACDARRAQRHLFTFHACSPPFDSSIGLVRCVGIRPRSGRAWSPTSGAVPAGQSEGFR